MHVENCKIKTLIICFQLKRFKTIPMSVWKIERIQENKHPKITNQTFNIFRDEISGISTRF